MFEHGGELVGQRSSDTETVGLWYDADRLTLAGIYLDEVTAYRARKRWIEALENNFLLEERQDFLLKVRPVHGGKYFKVRCEFLSACGRYAFWRLTHHQAPEVQFLLETAHLPNTHLEGWEMLANDEDAPPAAAIAESPTNGSSLEINHPPRPWRRAMVLLRGMTRRLLSSVTLKEPRVD